MIRQTRPRQCPAQAPARAGRGAARRDEPVRAGRAAGRSRAGAHVRRYSPVYGGAGIEGQDRKLNERVTKRIVLTLRHQGLKGTVRSQPGPGRMLLWEVVR